MSGQNDNGSFVTAYEYEEVLQALYLLQKSPEDKERLQQSPGHKDASIRKLPNMVKFIQRSGLTMEVIDQLPVVHVSGTKGKGSTCAFLERISHHHGYKTGLFSSPHLVEVRERIRINGKPIDKDMFCKYFSRVYNRLKDTQDSFPEEEGGGMPGYFAFLAVLSLHVFISEAVDVAVMEVGIGGQNDVTNILRAPLVCGVTSLGLDHTAILGDTIQQIAWHKAGIFKAGHPAVTVQQKTEAMAVILDRAKERQSPLFLSKSMSALELEKRHISLGIAGEKQSDNASLAIHLYNMFLHEQSKEKTSSRDSQNPSEISDVTDIPQLEIKHLDASTVAALRDCVWPGRAQKLVKGTITYYLDGAHTVESMEVCVNWFKQAADAERESTSEKTARILIFNLCKNRNSHAMLSLLKDANFDFAVFCTNLTSTIESDNRKDQSDRTKSMTKRLQWAERNQACWNELCSPSSVLPTENCNDFSTQDRSTLEISMQSLPYDNSNTPRYSKPVTAIRNDHGQTFRHPNHIDLVKVADLKPPNSCTVDRIDEELCKECHNEMNSPKHPCSSSYLFPCIMDALSWVTQGRDPLVTSPGTSLPPVPQKLLEVDRVQVLVTGSLLLVGGVLGVVDPHMND